MSTVEEEEETAAEGSSGKESGHDSLERDILRNSRRYTTVFHRIYLKVLTQPPLQDSCLITVFGGRT